MKPPPHDVRGRIEDKHMARRYGSPVRVMHERKQMADHPWASRLVGCQEWNVHLAHEGMRSDTII